MLWLSQFCFSKDETISLLKFIKTSSTSWIVSFVVTLNPLIKWLLIPNSFNLLFILFPPPWTTIGINPILFNVAISFIKISNKFLSTNTLPPHFMTIYSLLYFCKYFLTSSIDGPSNGNIFFIFLLLFPTFKFFFLLLFPLLLKPF